MIHRRHHIGTRLLLGALLLVIVLVLALLINFNLLNARNTDTVGNLSPILDHPMGNATTPSSAAEQARQARIAHAAAVSAAQKRQADARKSGAAGGSSQTTSPATAPRPYAVPGDDSGGAGSTIHSGGGDD